MEIEINNISDFDNDVKERNSEEIAFVEKLS